MGSWKQVKSTLALISLIGLMAGAGIVVLAGISLPAVTGSGHYEAKGAVRLLGLVPLALAGLICLGLTGGRAADCEKMI